MIKGIIFDLDGVLVSTDKMHFMAWKKLAESLGIHDFTEEDNKLQKGVSRMESLEVVLRKGKDVYSEEEKAALADIKNEHYKKLLSELDQEALLPGAVESLKLLRAMGIKTGVGSVSKNAPVILERTGLMPYIDEMSCGLDITRSKPDPEVFLVAAKKLGLQPEECLVVEDSAAGIVAAKAENMKSLGVGPEYQQLGADYEARNLAEVADWNLFLR